MELGIKPNIAITLKELLESLVLEGLPFALWREPNSKELELSVSCHKEPDLRRVDLEDLPAGFVLAPFDYDHSNKAVFIKADLYFRFAALHAPLTEEHLNSLDTFSLRLPAKKELVSETENPDLTKLISSTLTEKRDFEQLVEKAKDRILSGDFEKVVPSYKKSIWPEQGFDAIAHFEKLCRTYPAVFCSLTYLPWEEVFWLGATPETLVQQDEDGIFQTMALAGTQSAYDPAGNEVLPADAPWVQKEIEEQALVCRFIINSFKKIRVREYTEIGPKTVKAGNLLHLQSTFKVDTEAISFPQMAGVMLDLLHPTSAVCGMPKPPAAAFLRQEENHDREFYSGFLGPVNVDRRTRLFVNLRTMKLQDGRIDLFAGCGITADSTASREWNEIQMKLKTVLA